MEHKEYKAHKAYKDFIQYRAQPVRIIERNLTNPEQNGIQISESSKSPYLTR
jgi:hypothetical protein